MIDLTSAGLRKHARLANKHKLTYGLFAKFSLVVVGACELDKKIHIFLTISNQHIQ